MKGDYRMENEKVTCKNCGSLNIQGSLSDGNIFLNGPPIIIQYRVYEVPMKRCKDCGLLWGYTVVE